MRQEVRQVKLEVIAEEVLDHCGDANNGAGPLWCFGSPTIVRDGDRMFASVWQVGADVKPLCNTRWQLFSREEGGQAELVQAAQSFNEREPCPLMRLPGGRIILSVNPAVSLCGKWADGRSSYYCQPQLLEFSAADPKGPPASHAPVWDRRYVFTEHSYRACAADRLTGDLLVLNQTHDDELSKQAGESIYSQCWSYRDAAGAWSRQGLLRFPLRGCYAQVALRNRAAYVFAISDIIEPVPEWREYKKKVTGNDWDYEFRQLFFTWTPDITSAEFWPILTVASRDETAGILRNLDMWVGPDGDAHLIYTDRNVWHTFMRDRFFAGLPITVALKYCRVRKGVVVERRTLAECAEEQGGQKPPPGADSLGFHTRDPLVTCAALHATPDGRLFVIYGASIRGVDSNWLLQVVPPGKATPVRVNLKTPLRSFFAATERLGTEPSYAIDLYGLPADPHAIRYAQLMVS